MHAPSYYDPFDLQRIAVGEPSWPFLIEVLLRACATYVALLAAMRCLGRRVTGQATLFEMSVVVMLAGAIGAALQAPDRGLAAPLVILVTAVLLQRVLGHLAVRWPRFDAVVSGASTPLVRDGRVLVEQTRRVVLSRDKLFAMLRLQQVQHLGEVHRAQLEANGELTLVKAHDEVPGLPIFPDDDTELRGENVVAGLDACNGCGHVRPAASGPPRCPHCCHDTWSACMKRLER